MRDLCANCDRWREQHYSAGGAFVADRMNPPCFEYSGTEPSDERRKQKADELSEDLEWLPVNQPQ